MNKMPRSGRALDVFIAKDYLAKYPTHIAKLVANSNAEQEDLFDRTIIAAVHKLVRSARVIYPKRLAA